MTVEENLSLLIAKKLEDGTIEKIIEEKLTSAIDSAVGDIFRWGDGEKAIKEKLKQVMIPVIERHNFNDYALKIDTALTEIINKTSLVDNKHILESFKELMIEPEIKEIKLSTIFEEYKKYVAENVDTDGLEANCEDGDPYYDYVEVSVNVEKEEKKYFKSSYDDARIIFSCEHDKKEELEYTLDVYRRKGEDKNWSILRTGISESIDINSLSTLSKFEILLLKLSRAHVKIELDIDYDSDEVEPDAKPEWDLN